MLEQFGQFGAGLERRMQNRTLTEYRNRRNWLLREVQECEKNIKEIKKQINRVHKSYETNKIGYEQYIILLADRYNGKTLSQWKENREKLQKLYEKHVNDYDKGLSLSLLLIILTLGLLPLIILGDFNGLMEITGSAVEQIYGFGVPLEVDEEVINTTTPFEATTSTTIILPIENYTIPIKNITAPVLIKNIPNIEIQKNSFAELSVLEYFENAETVFILQIENISTSSSGYNIKILPDKEFVGIRTLGIMAINDLAKIESNFFNVSVLEVRAPELVKKIPDISINKNSFIKLNILEYFLNADQFFLLQTTNITTSIYDHTVKIQPDVGFIGTRTMKIISTNELGKAESDFFNLFILENVTEIPGEEVTTTSTTTLLEGTSTTTDIILTTTSTIEITLPETTTTSTTSTSILSGFGEQAFTVQQAEGLWTLYFNNTASGGSCPTNSKLMYTSVSGATAITWPGDFDSGLPGGADAGQWAPGKPNRGNTTNSFEINTTTQTSRTSDSFGSGWLYDGNLTGWVLSDGNFTFNLSIVGGAMVETVIAERIFARASIVTCSGGAFTHVKDLFTTGCTGGSCGGGQGGWRANEGARIQHPGVNIINNTYVNVTANDTSSHQFSEGQWLFIELGFGDGGSTTNRAIGLRYNLVGSYVITPNMATTTTSTSSSSTSSSTLPHANLTLYLRNSTAQASFTGLYTNISALTNETVNITSIVPYPADVNMTLYVMDYAGINQSRNISKSFLQNFTTFWTTGSFLINITWEGNLTMFGNSTAFWIDVLATTTTSSTSSTLPKGYFELWLNGTKNANLTTYTNNSVNITVNSLTPADANTTLFITNYAGVNVSFNYSKSFLENITNFWTDGNFLANISWEGNLTSFGNSTAFYVTVIATSTSTTSTTLNAIPVISDISGIGTQTISEQTQAYVTLYFNVSDANGAGNINGSSGKAQFNQSSIYRTNKSCNSLGAVNSSTMRFECTLDIWYFDANDWGYNVSIFDNDSNYVEDTNQAFSIGQTRGMAMSPTALTFPTVTLGTGNISATNDPIIVNNSGNVDIALGRMNVTSYNLHGLTTTGEFISATNFTVNNTDSCAGSVGGIQLANNTKYILTQNLMNAGNVSLGGTFNTTLYFCLWNAPAVGISGQIYDTSASSAWEVRVF